MKGLNLLYAFLGGALVGCGAALLFAPEKGEKVRGMLCDKTVEMKNKISKMLRRNGINISDDEVDALVAEFTAEN